MKIFLSAVSSQFKASRDALASDLSAVGAEVIVQETFQQHGRTLLEKLENYIASCDRTIALVGSAYGWEPELNALPPGKLRRSYTQWEYYFAEGERLDGPRRTAKDIYVYFASPEFLSRNPVSQPADAAKLQEQFIAHICSSGKDRNEFSSLDQLRALVLRDGFRIAERRPPPQNLPDPSLGTLFKGRDAFLAELHQSLQRAANGHATALVGKALHGLGGVGKTRLAVEYAWQHEQDYSALLFVVADSPENLHRNLAALAGPLVLNLPEQGATEEEVRMAAAVRWLDQHPGWLLILDNVDSSQAAAAAEAMLARLRGGTVLITSRRTQWSASVDPRELDVLARADAAQFILERTGRSRRKLPADDASAAELAHELDGLALALEQAAAYIAERRISLADYLRDWRARLPAVQEWHNPQLMKYPHSVAVTWETTLAQLNPGEVALLRLFAHFAPDPIPLFILEGEKAEKIWQEAIALHQEEAGPAAGVPGQIPDALATLANYSMIKRDAEEQTATVHRVVQEILRNRLPEPRRKAWLTLSLRLLDQARTGDPADVRTWPRWNPLRPHVATAVAQADQAGITEPTATLMNELGVLLSAKALHREAEPWKRRALAIGEQNLGRDHPNVAIHLNNLAQLLQATNRLGEAEPLMRRALDIDEQSFGPDHPDVARDLNNLARLLQDSNRLGEAEPLMRRALAIDEKSFGPDHPDVAIRLNNLAGLLQATDRLGEAEPLMRRALVIFARSLTVDHPNTQTVADNYRILLTEMGKRPDEIRARLNDLTG